MKKIEWFTAHRFAVPEEYEAWLERKAEEGWHPIKIRQFSSIRMVFEQGVPKKYQYSVELLGRLSGERKAMYADFGWEYVGRMSNVFVFRKEYTEKRPEMFSDRTSVVKRTERYVTAIWFSLGLFLMGFIINAGLAAVKLFGHLAHDWTDILISLAVCGGAAVYLFTVVKKLNKSIHIK